ncbi:MAG TPA: DNA polymerase IV [Pseudomonadales bacterium]|nr:DNA polymerase IV [Pseudomonadales bacterium]
MNTRQRKIIHIDMDCFYAAVEMRDNPSLKGIPIAVGGSPTGRGVITTCNYEAREFGVHSAMATAYALRLCPALTVLPVRMSYYKEVSGQIREIFRRYTQVIEPLSLDEAYLDVTDVEGFSGSATLMAKDIRATISRELALTASAGVAPNKFLAKICSDENKPDGLCVVTPDEVDAFVEKLPLSKIPGVGKVTLKRLGEHGLKTCRDVRELGETELIRRFGGLGQFLFKRACGIDERELTTHWVRKSLSVERTFPEDIPDPESIGAVFDKLYEELARRLEASRDRQIRNQQVKLKFSDFQVTTMERSSRLLDKSLFQELIPLAWERGVGKGIRLLGIGVSFKDDDPSGDDAQLSLFQP